MFTAFLTDSLVFNAAFTITAIFVIQPHKVWAAEQEGELRVLCEGKPLMPYLMDNKRQEYKDEMSPVETFLEKMITNLSKVPAKVTVTRLEPAENYSLTIVSRVRSQKLPPDLGKTLSQIKNGAACGEDHKSRMSWHETSRQCPRTTTILQNGHKVTWPATPAGTESAQVCSHFYFDPNQLALRKCTTRALRAIWLHVDDKRCLNFYMSPPLPDVSIAVTRFNAEIVLMQIRTRLANQKKLSNKEFLTCVHLLERTATPTVLKALPIQDRILQLADKLVSQFKQMPLTTENKARASAGLLLTIYNTPKYLRLEKEKYMFKAESFSLAVYAMPVDLSFPFLCVHLYPGHIQLNYTRTAPKEPDRDVFYLSTGVLRDSLRDGERLRRISLVAYNDGTLFTLGSYEKFMPTEKPKQMLNNSSGSRGSGWTRYFSAFFRPGKWMEDVIKTNYEQGRITILSKVMSANVQGVDAANQGAAEVVRFTLPKDLKPRSAADEIRCVAFAGDDVNFAQDYSVLNSTTCYKVTDRTTHTTCSCRHTEWMGVVAVTPPSINTIVLTKKNTALAVVMMVGCLISAVSLLITIIFYICSRNNGTGPRFYIMISLCMSLLIFNCAVILGLQDSVYRNNTACKVVAICTHYFLLTSLSWMGVQGFYLYLYLIKVFWIIQTNFLKKATVIAWGGPLMIVVIPCVINFNDFYGQHRRGCWIHDRALILAVVLPAGLIFLLNSVVFISICIHLKRMMSGSSRGIYQAMSLGQLKGAMGVTVLLGITWVFGFLPMGTGMVAVVFEYLFALFNSLQGFFIFVFYCASKKEIKNEISKARNRISSVTIGSCAEPMRSMIRRRSKSQGEDFLPPPKTANITKTFSSEGISTPMTNCPHPNDYSSTSV